MCVNDQLSLQSLPSGMRHRPGIGTMAVPRCQPTLAALQMWQYGGEFLLTQHHGGAVLLFRRHAAA